MPLGFAVEWTDADEEGEPHRPGVELRPRANGQAQRKDPDEHVPLILDSE